MKRVITFEFDGTDIETDNYRIDTLMRADVFRGALDDVYAAARAALKYGDTADATALTAALEEIKALASVVLD
jgi:hypothetical protein